jgi:hypothetical protein
VDEAIAQATGEKKAPSSQANAEATEKVFVRRGGSHYHKEGCRHLRNRGGQAIPKAQAVKKGFRRCPSCRP